MLKKLIRTNPIRTIILIRFMVGLVFVSEGVQKFIFPAKTGAGRFEKIGFASPGSLANLVGCFEIVCGLLVVLGLLTRLAVLPLIGIMLVAIITTKLPVLDENGFWAMLHESRTDWSMLMGSIFLFISGGGKWSLDLKINPK